MNTRGIVKTGRVFLGNRFSRALLKFYTKKDSTGNIILNKKLQRYFNGEVTTGEKLGIAPITLVLKMGRGLFGVDEKPFREWFQNATNRRGLVNAIRSIGEYGVTMPQKFSAPFLVVWNYTNACNLHCRHCYQKAGEPLKDELSTEERLGVVDQLIHEDVVFLALSGGEPLLREDIYEVAKRASDEGIFVSMATNGTLLTKKRVEKLVKYGVKHVQVSLDGATPQIHDAFRGVSGAWDKTIRGIKNSVGSDLMTTIATTITRQNYNDFDKIVALAEKLKVDQLVIYNFIPTGRGKEIIQTDITPSMREKLLHREYDLLAGGFDLVTTAPQLARICVSSSENGPMAMGHFASREFDSRLRMAADFIGGCGAGRTYCAIQPNGDVTPCVFMPIVVGNLREADLEEIWRNSDVLKSLRVRDDLKGSCGKCKYRYLCGGCRARGHAYFGDFKASDPGCIYNEKLWEDIAL